MATIGRFIQLERPATLVAGSWEAPGTTGVSPPFRTVGEPYGLIGDGLRVVPDLLVGHPNRQVGNDVVDFPDRSKIASADDVLRAAAMAEGQGEGARTAFGRGRWRRWRASSSLSARR